MLRKNLRKKSPEEKRDPIPKKKLIISVFLIGFAFFGSYLIYFILQLALNTSTPMVVVVSGSMEPNINKGDLLFVQGVDPEDIEEGDVIVFDAHGLWFGAPEDPIVHRVIDIDEDDGKLYFETKGDANNKKDEEPIPENRVLGVVIGRIPYVGWIKIILTDYGLLLPVIIILSIPLVISILWDLVREEVEGKDESVEKIKKISVEKDESDQEKYSLEANIEEHDDDDFDF
jgi:signal peptidase